MNARTEGTRGESDEPSSISSTLLDRVKADRPEAWTRLVTLYGPVIYRWCRQAGAARDDAPDLVQEVFAAIARHVGSFRRDRPGDSFGARLRTITRNTIRGHFRSRRGQAVARGGTDAQAQLHQVPEPLEAVEAGDPREVADLVLPIGLELVRAEFESRTWRHSGPWRSKASRGPGGERSGDERRGGLPSQVPRLRRLRRELDGLL